jgi:hypothetical protein
MGRGSIIETVIKNYIFSGVFASAAAGIVAGDGDAGVGEIDEAGEENEFNKYLSLIYRYRLRYSE